MGKHLEQAALALGDDVGHARHRVRQELSILHHAKPPRPFSDEHVAAGEERDGPGMDQRLYHRDDPVVVERRFVDGSLGCCGRRGGQGKGGEGHQRDADHLELLGRRG